MNHTKRTAKRTLENTGRILGEYAGKSDCRNVLMTSRIADQYPIDQIPSYVGGYSKKFASSANKGPL
jgi:hypothetical protein